MNKPSSNKIRIVVITGLLAIVLGIGTISMLKYLNFKSAKTSSEIATKQAPSHDKIIEQYKSMLKKYPEYKARTEKYTTTTVTYKKDSSGYQITLPAESLAQYDTSKSTDIQQVRTLVKNFLTGLGLKQKETTAIGSTSFTTFFSSKSICQSTEAIGGQASQMTFGLACLSSHSANTKYDFIGSLLNLYTKNGGTSTGIRSVMDTTYSEKERSLTTLSISKTDEKQKPLTLIFVNMGKGWEYLGERPTPSIDDKASYEMPAALKKAIANPKYADFVAKYIK